MLLQASAHSTVEVNAHNVHRPVPSKGTGFWTYFPREFVRRTQVKIYSFCISTTTILFLTSVSDACNVHVAVL